MKRLYFGTDGVRGPFGGPVINVSFAARLGYAAGVWAGGSGTALIGRDTRASGESLSAAVAAGLRAAGVEPIILGIMPTPAVARAVRVEGATLGVVITASHNPASDNGIKFFSSSGTKLADADEATIESLLPPDPRPARPGAIIRRNLLQPYLSATLGLLPPDALAGWKIVLDTANGATCGTSPDVLRKLGAEIIGIGDVPNGENINADVGSEHPEALAARVVKEGARLGVAHDGDGDRCVLCDERGGVLDGDEILTLLALHELRAGRLPHGKLVVTVQSNLGVDAAVSAAGGTVLRTDVGDRYVIERMLAEGATLGGESSGHIICSDVSPTGDGLVAALKVIEVMRASGQPLSTLRTTLRKFPQKTAALKVRVKKPLAGLPLVNRAITEVQSGFGPAGRVLVRYSGTEAKLRLLVEGPDEASVASALNKLEAAVRQDLEVL
jgi:phosphoglucosamine mutase